jgi:hypothetical protein
VLPDIFLIRSSDDLAAIWRQGRSTGMTDKMRLEYLLLLDTHRRLEQFNGTIQIWIDAVNDYTLAKLQRPPRPGSWSLGQVYMHILDDTEWFVGQMAAAQATRENREMEMHEDAKRMFGDNAFPDAQIQGPATNTLIPQPESKEELSRRLTAIKTEVNRLFSGFDVTRGVGKTAHPGLRFFNTGEWLQFAEMHMRHHLRQKQRIDEQLRLLPD